jgi:hypothetical protein
MNQIIKSLAGLLTMLSMVAGVQAATINIGSVANSANTGFYVLENGSLNTTGKIRVGTFTKTQSELTSIIGAWGSDKSPSLLKYNELNSYFNEVGIGGTRGSTVPNWSFDGSGKVAGTSNAVDTTIVPLGSQLYVWAFTISSFTSSAFTPTSSLQWALVTDSAEWLAPSSGTKSLNLAQIDAAGVLIGTDNGTGSGYNNVSMVAAVPEPSTGALMVISAAGLVALRRLRKV